MPPQPHWKKLKILQPGVRYKWMVTTMWHGVLSESCFLFVCFGVTSNCHLSENIFSSVLKDLEFWKIISPRTKQKTEVDENWWLTILFLRRHYRFWGAFFQGTIFSCFGGVVNVLASHDLKETTSFPPDVMAWSTPSLLCPSWEYSNNFEYLSPYPIGIEFGITSKWPLRKKGGRCNLWTWSSLWRRFWYLGVSWCFGPGFVFTSEVIGIWWSFHRFYFLMTLKFSRKSSNHWDMSSFQHVVESQGN